MVLRTKDYDKRCFINVICIYLHTLVSNTYQYQMMFVSFITNTTGVTSEAGTVTSFTENKTIKKITKHRII
jgi:hypothetical protein